MAKVIELIDEGFVLRLCAWAADYSKDDAIPGEDHLCQLWGHLDHPADLVPLVPPDVASDNTRESEYGRYPIEESYLTLLFTFRIKI